MEGGKPLTAKEKRQEQIKRWQNSATDLECATYANPKTRVKFDDGAVFLAACSAGDLGEVKALLDGGADINFANVDGLTALHQVGSTVLQTASISSPFILRAPSPKLSYFPVILYLLMSYVDGYMAYC